MGFVKRQVKLENLLSKVDIDFKSISDKEYRLLKERINDIFIFSDLDALDLNQLPNIFDAFIINVEQHGRKVSPFGYEINNLEIRYLDHIIENIECFILDKDLQFIITNLDKELSMKHNIYP